MIIFRKALDHQLRSYLFVNIVFPKNFNCPSEINIGNVATNDILFGGSMEHGESPLASVVKYRPQ